MLKLTDINGRAVFVAASNVARVNVAGESSRWHGIRSIVKLFDGAVIECQQDADEVAALVEASKPQGEGVA